MWTHLTDFLRTNPVGLLFAVLGIGYLVGKTRIRGFDLGSISGVLFVGARRVRRTPRRRHDELPDPCRGTGGGAHR